MSATIQFQWDGEERDFVCFENCFSRVTCQSILDGQTYPLIPFVRDVETVLDIGSNVGAATVLFSLAYPEATIHSFEPGSRPYRLLEKNTAARPGVHIHNFGLHSSNVEAPLYWGKYDTGQSSVARSDSTRENGEVVRLRSVREWLDENGVDRIDVLKIDTEGCEVPILESIGDVLPNVQVVYLEYHNDDDRKAFDRILGDSHLLMHGRMLAHIGEVTYVAKEAARAEPEVDRRAMRLEL